MTPPPRIPTLFPHPPLLRPPPPRAGGGGPPLHPPPPPLLSPFFPAEPLHAPRRIHQLLLAGEERMALGADLHVNHGHGGPRHEAVAAGALHRGPLVGGVNPGFHCSHPCLGIDLDEGRKYNWHRKLAA